jgi:hypothetical protein
VELEAFTTLVTGRDHPEGVWGPDGRVYAGGEAGQIGLPPRTALIA